MSNRVRIVLSLLLLAASMSLLIAQRTQSRIYGKVSGSDGTPLRDVLVTATNADTGAQSTRTSDKRGNFRFLSVAPGPYQVKFEKEGYLVHAVMCVMNTEQSVGLKVELKKEKPES